ncbi:hypothetical protein Bbelb_447140 [Branchiostoma belcheri]|nr:hypothetical protein Bbelb_447140 [Branchiostoma belcheri]
MEFVSREAEDVISLFNLELLPNICSCRERQRTSSASSTWNYCQTSDKPDHNIGGTMAIAEYVDKETDWGTLAVTMDHFDTPTKGCFPDPEALAQSSKEQREHVADCLSERIAVEYLLHQSGKGDLGGCNQDGTSVPDINSEEAHDCEEDHNTNIKSLNGGVTRESVARKAYFNMDKTKHKNLTIKETWLIMHHTKSYLGASPDGIVLCKCCPPRILEIKCPYSAANEKIRGNPKIKYIEEAAGVEEARVQRGGDVAADAVHRDAQPPAVLAEQLEWIRVLTMKTGSKLTATPCPRPHMIILQRGDSPTSSQNPDENLAALDEQGNNHLSEQHMSEETGQRREEPRTAMLGKSDGAMAADKGGKGHSSKVEESPFLLLSKQSKKKHLKRHVCSSQKPDGNVADLDKEGNRVPSKVERTGRGGSMRVEYHRLSSRVPGIFSQYRYQETNFNRRNKVYRGLYGILVYGLHRANSDKFLLYSNDILQVVWDTYPSGDDQDWQLINRNNRPTKDIEKFVFGDTSRFRKTARQVQRTLHRISGAKRGECAGCLFLLSDGRPVSTDHFSNTLRKCLELAHLDSQAFTARSFRIGAATHAASSGASHAQLRALVFRCLYWTDSPSSQYRNKTMSSVISEHEALFGIPACWNYFEAEHGKGPCDGIGGTAKRMADQAVTTQGTTIQDAHEFYMWASQLEKSAISYMFVSKDECEESRAYLALKYGKVKAIAGTKLVGDKSLENFLQELSTTPKTTKIKAQITYLKGKRSNCPDDLFKFSSNKQQHTIQQLTQNLTSILSYPAISASPLPQPVEETPPPAPTREELNVKAAFAKKANEARHSQEGHLGTCTIVQSDNGTEFKEKVNEKRVCASPGCSGPLVPSKVEMTGRGGSMRVEYHRLSSRVPGIFSQYRYQETNFNRRNKVYRGLYGILVYGLHRASSDKFLLYSNDILQVVWDTYPSGDDVDWQLINRNNRPTKDIEVKDLFEDKNLDSLQTLCLIVLGFSGFLRWDDLRQLHVDDIAFCNGYVTLFLPKKKGMTNSERVTGLASRKMTTPPAPSPYYAAFYEPKVRSNGLSSREFLYQRDRFTGEQILLSYRRLNNHLPSTKSKAPNCKCKMH